MEKNYFQFYETFLATVEALTENEQLKFYRAICRYGLFDELPDFEGKDKAIFLQIQFAIDNQKKRRLINRKNIQKRYEQLQNTTTTNEPLQNAEMNRNEENRNELNRNSASEEATDFSSEKSPQKKSSHFVKPTVEEIRAYCNERRNNVAPQQFFDYYESKGWCVGKAKMKDWKAAVRNWERNSFDRKQTGMEKVNAEYLKTFNPDEAF